MNDDESEQASQCQGSDQLKEATCKGGRVPAAKNINTQQAIFGRFGFGSTAPWRPQNNKYTTAPGRELLIFSGSTTLTGVPTSTTSRPRERSLS